MNPLLVLLHFHPATSWDTSAAFTPKLKFPLLNHRFPQVYSPRAAPGAALLVLLCTSGCRKELFVPGLSTVFEALLCVAGLEGERPARLTRGEADRDTYRRSAVPRESATSWGQFSQL